MARAEEGNGRLTVRLLATTDLHGHLLPWDYARGAVSPGAGLAVLAAQIEQARANVANSLLFDVGDLLQGTPLADLAARQGAGAGPHPLVAALDLLGVDAATLGNHDFDHGLEALCAAYSGASFPVVAANVESGLPGWPVRPGVILERDFLDSQGQRHLLRVGVTGVLPPETARWNGGILGPEVKFTPMVPAARAEVARLRRAGAELVVVLAHTGLAGAGPVPDPDQRAEELACIEGVDAVLAGHSHRAEALPAGALAPGSAPVVVGPANAGGVAMIDLTLDLSLRPVRRGSEARVIGAARSDPPNPRLLAAGRRVHARVEVALVRQIGRLSTPIRTHFALVADASAMDFVGRAKAEWVAAHLPPAEPQGLPIVAASAPFRVGAFDAGYLDIAPGPLRLRDLHAIYGFANTVVACIVRGGDLVAWLERSACIYNRLEPGRGPQPLLAPGAAGFNFDVISDLSWEIDLAKPPAFDPAGRMVPGAGRVSRVRWKGRPLDEGQPFILVTNSFRAGGGGGFPGVERFERLPLPSVRVLDVLADHAARHQALAPIARPGWCFAPVEGAEACFEAPADAPVPVGAPLRRAGASGARRAEWRLLLGRVPARAERAG